MPSTKRSRGRNPHHARDDGRGAHRRANAGVRDARGKSSRTMIALSWRPTKMNASTFSTKTPNPKPRTMGCASAQGSNRPRRRRGHGENHHGENSGEVQALCEHPNREGGAKLDDDRDADIV